MRTTDQKGRVMSTSMMYGMIKDQGTRHQIEEAAHLLAYGRVEAVARIYVKVVGHN